MENENAEKALSPTILYEDDDVVVIDKPTGIFVHGDGTHTEATIVDWFLARAPEARGVGEPTVGRSGEPLERSGVVHRLDKETSGALLLVKNQQTFLHIKEQFKNRLAKKEYRAFVYGTMKEKWGTINRPIGRSAKNFKLRSAQRGAKGTIRSAVTEWELIGQNETHAYLKLFPKTGRMHQIRVHLKAIGRPVVKDKLYAPQNLLDSDNLGFDRLALHAHTLALTLPNGEEKRFIAPLPQVFEDAVEKII